MNEIIARREDKSQPGKFFGHRGYTSQRARRIAVSMLRKRGFNYFVMYADTQATHALTYGFAAWVPANTIYINR